MISLQKPGGNKKQRTYRLIKKAADMPACKKVRKSTGIETEKYDLRRRPEMKKNLGIVQAVYPMPVLMVAAYDENGKVNVMNAAWGMICNTDRIALFIDEDHKTTQNILKTKAFTVSLADKEHMDVADFFGIATGNKMSDKFERTGYTAVKSEFVNAPVIDEFPVVMECELAEVVENESFYCIVGKIMNTAAEEKVLSENGKVDPAKLQALIFDQFQHGYYVSGEQVGKAWNAGAGLMKK
jgi:flavin reductase (DIM6/NTAB) family NADH-FMN oxidoreductase RutF